MFEVGRRLLEMIRFSHTVFAMPFALFAATLAWTTPLPDSASTAPAPSLAETSHQSLQVPFRALDLVGILLCLVFARSAAMAFNRLVDRHLDSLNPRTANRHLPAGQLSVQGVTLFTILNSAGFLLSTLLFLPNPWPIRLAVPVLLVLLAYSYTKRFTSLAHFWLGLSLMLAPVSAWIAIRGQWLAESPADLLPSIFLGGAVLSWVAGFDIIYACQDADFDREAKLHSIPARWGVSAALRLSACCHFVTVLLLAILPLAFPQLGLGWLYLTGILAVGILLAYEHWLVKPDDLTRVNVAFFQVNAVISLGLFAVGSADLFLLSGL
jgi:4-hydroxybenzoate polyprenyltransferase